MSSKDSEFEHDKKIVEKTRNTARYFTEHAQVAWVALILTLGAGVFSYIKMPKAKDPFLEVKLAVATCVWPGAEAEKVEQLVTKKIEQKLGESPNIQYIDSISRSHVSIVYVLLLDEVKDRTKELSDLQNRLDSIKDLPPGAGPIRFEKDFGDTATLLLTIASPTVGEVELDLRAEALSNAIKKVRGDAPAGRTSLVLNFPPDSEPGVLERLATAARGYFATLSKVSDARLFEGPGFLGLDVSTTLSDAELLGQLRRFASDHLRLSELHPDVWPLALIHDPKETREKLAAVAADRYTYHELDKYTDLIQRFLQRLPIVSRVTRTGVVPEQIYLEYSQERIASYGLELAKLGQILAARNITTPGGVIEVGGKNVTVDPSGEFTSVNEIGEVVVTTSASGAPVYLRDLVSISREYVSPARFLNFITAREPSGKVGTHRGITLAINMRQGAQIADFGAAVDRELETIKRLLPEDLIYQRVSDQPLQVKENVKLFMSSLYEAIALVVLVALIGFWEWRTAMLLALAIPVTLAMTFGMMYAWGVDLQQISIASLIIALGLLIDDPVVAGDAIKQSIAVGWKPRVAAWLGPTKLAKAIMFATVTNIAAYLPFLTLGGDTGTFLVSLPLVLTMSLIASRLVSMTFIPLLGKLLLRPLKKPAPTAEERRSRGFGRVYAAIVGWSIDHRKLVFVLSLGFIAGGAFIAKDIKQAFFPKDLSYLSFIDVWLPEDAPLSETRARVEDVRRELAAEADAYAKEHDRPPEEILESITAYVGGGGPRFWFSISPEAPQLNYAQLLIKVKDKHDTEPLVHRFQERLTRNVAGARIDVRQLETGKPVGIPVSFRISGEDIQQLRIQADKFKAVLRQTPGAYNVRDDWGNDTFAVKLEVDSDRANLSGVTNLDIAASSATAMSGAVVSQLREGDRSINIVTRLRADERSQISDVQDLYVTSLAGPQKVLLRQVSRINYSFQTEKIRRRNQFRTITVSCFPAAGVLPSEVLTAALPKIDEVARTMPPGYRYDIAGEYAEKKKGDADMAIVAILMLVSIFIALVVQFRSAIKPIIVFAALPFGAIAAVVSLVIAKAPLGFMAILGIISLMGVIVSHIIVLFDFIEEGHERGEPMRETLIDAGLMRLRPVLVTVIATVLGLIPLALNGGPLWEPLCYAQIGGLSFATFITLILVPVLYTIFIRDLKLIKWERSEARYSAMFILPPHMMPPQAPPEQRPYDPQVPMLPTVVVEQMPSYTPPQQQPYQPPPYGQQPPYIPPQGPPYGQQPPYPPQAPYNPPQPPHVPQPPPVPGRTLVGMRSFPPSGAQGSTPNGRINPPPDEEEQMTHVWDGPKPPKKR